MTKHQRTTMAKNIAFHNSDFGFADCLDCVDEVLTKASGNVDIKNMVAYVYRGATNKIRNRRDSMQKRQKRESNYTRHNKNVSIKVRDNMTTVDIFGCSNTVFRDLQFRDDVHTLPPIPRMIVILILDYPEYPGIVGTDTPNKILGKVRNYLIGKGIVNSREYYECMHYLRNFLKNLKA